MLKFILVALFSVSTLKAQEVLPGMIPRFYSIEAATDLPFSPEIAHERATKGEDLSLIDPKSNTNIWNPRANLIPDHRLIAKDETVRFVKEMPSRNGQLRFTVVTKENRELTLILSKKVHSLLLRRNILAKLGYATQPMSWVPRLKIEFSDTIDRDLFKEEMKDKLLAGTERWIRSEEGLTLTVQDALALTTESDIYNLASGLMPSNVHMGRRLLRAPYVPLALVDTTESINLMPWTAGRMILNHVKLNHTQDLDVSYGTSWEDARWIGRRLVNLGRGDFEEIVGKAYFPEAVEKLLTEKIIARRNDLISLLDLKNLTQDIPFNPELSHGDGLKKGEIVQEFFDGYASRFSYGDPESPFSASELGSFALSRVQAETIEIALNQFNNLLATDTEEKYIEKMKEIIKKDGPFFPTQGVAVPTLQGSLILSRDIIAGSYLGTNNKVQLVDNFGYAVDAGVFGGVEGIPFPVPVSLKGAAGIAYQRVFSHVKPVQSLKKSMKEPYKNMIVSLLVKNLAQKMDRLSTVEGGNQEALLQSIAQDLKNTIGIGESFIITDSVVPKVFGELQFSISQIYAMDENLLKVYGRAQSERMMMSRFHLHRADENTIHVYQDYGKNLRLMLSVKLKSYVPILGVNARWNKASAETHFYPISLHPRTIKGAAIKALRSSLLALNHDALGKVITPHKVEHAIKEGANTFEFFYFRRNQVYSDQTMKLTHAIGGAKKDIHRRYDSVTSGIDVDNYSVDAFNTLLSALTKSDFSLSMVQGINPGLSVSGKAKNRIFISEYDGERVTTSFQRILNGWRVTPKKMRGLIETINREAGVRVFDPLQVVNTDSILLYQISFNYTMTQEGVEKLLLTPQNQLKDILLTHGQRSFSDEELNSLSTKYESELKRIRKEIAASGPEAGLKRYHSFLKDLQNNISIAGLEILVGKANLAYQGRIEGFRQGDENGDSPIFSNVYGELPLPLHVTPTQSIMQNWGILEGELLANWMMERAL